MNLLVVVLLLVGCVVITAEEEHVRGQSLSVPPEESNLKKREGARQYKIVYMTREQLAEYQAQQQKLESHYAEKPEEPHGDSSKPLSEFPEPQEPIKTVNPPDDHEKLVALHQPQPQQHNEPRAIPIQLIPQYYYAAPHPHYTPGHFKHPQIRKLHPTHGHVQVLEHPQIQQLHPTHGPVQVLEHPQIQQLHPSHGPVQVLEHPQIQQLHPTHGPVQILEHPQIQQLHPSHGPVQVLEHPQIQQLHPSHGPVQVLEHSQIGQLHQTHGPVQVVIEPYQQSVSDDSSPEHHLPEQQEPIPLSLSPGPQPQYLAHLPEPDVNLLKSEYKTEHLPPSHDVILEVTKNDISDLSNELKHRLFFPGLTKPKIPEPLPSYQAEEVKAVKEDPEPDVPQLFPKFKLLPYQNTPVTQTPNIHDINQPFIPHQNNKQNGPIQFENNTPQQKLQWRNPQQYAPNYFAEANTISKKEIEEAKARAHAHAEAINREPAKIVHTDINIVRKTPIFSNIYKTFKVPVPHPVLYPVATPQHVPQPYAVRLEIIRPYAVPIVKTEQIEVEKKVPVEVEKRVPVEVEKKVYVKVNKPYIVERQVPIELTKEVKVPYTVYKPKQLHIVRHVYDKNQW